MGPKLLYLARILGVIAREWFRIGCLGFGGPPAHMSMLRRLCVEKRRWLTAEEFEDAIAACNLLPGPASTQLSIFCAWRLAGPAGALVGGLCFVLPGLLAVLALAAVFLAPHPPRWVLGAGAGAAATVAAVALQAGLGLAPASFARATGGAGEPEQAKRPREVGRPGGPHGSSQRPGLHATGARRLRWVLYAALGALAAALLGPWLVLVLLACGLAELGLRGGFSGLATLAALAVPRSPRLPLPLALAGTGGLGALAWTSLKVGALSYGGGFVIVPLMRSDAVHVYHWMTATQFLDAVALGQITPGPVTHTVAVVGYAAHGLGGGLLAAAVAFAPSFAFVLAGARRFDRLRRDRRARAFLDGAGPAAIGAILGSAVPLALALTEVWQIPVLAGAALALLALRRSPPLTILAAALVGLVAVLAGAPLPR
jgi:chromate transporter